MPSVSETSADSGRSGSGPSGTCSGPGRRASRAEGKEGTTSGKSARAPRRLRQRSLTQGRPGTGARARGGCDDYPGNTCRRRGQAGGRGKGSRSRRDITGDDVQRITAPIPCALAGKAARLFTARAWPGEAACRLSAEFSTELKARPGSMNDIHPRVIKSGEGFSKTPNAVDSLLETSVYHHSFCLNTHLFQQIFPAFSPPPSFHPNLGN